MAVRIRLSLHGCTNRPFYHIVVATSKSKRDGRHIEQVKLQKSIYKSRRGPIATDNDIILHAGH